MGNEVDARTQRFRNHLPRPDHPDRHLANTKVGSTVNQTVPGCGAGVFGSARKERRLADRRLAVRKLVEHKTPKLATISATLTHGNRREWQRCTDHASCFQEPKRVVSAPPAWPQQTRALHAGPMAGAARRVPHRPK
jgi:hypothetical protein